MSILKILYFPNKLLKKKASLVSKIDRDINKIINDMFETMYISKGIGLAATQVSINKCIIVIDISKKHNQQLVLINPKIIKRTGKIIMEESCLSIPNISAPVIRSEKIILQSLNYYGKLFELQAESLLSVCIQHEIDHLNGLLFIDRLSLSKKNYIRNIINHNLY
ncbi:MAG: peptide deformylase [Candidatus Lightella neohaematopini]|nr:peptide deformylase [Candidatus Lightella neohaematopini]